MWFNGSVLYVWDGNAWVPASTTKSYIQPTAPPSPNPGDTWWDGSVQRIWTGSAWALVGPGAFVGPVGTSTITFAIAQPTSVAVPASVFEPMPFTTTPMVDTQSAYDPITHRVTPKVAVAGPMSARCHSAIYRCLDPPGWPILAHNHRESGEYRIMPNNVPVMQRPIASAPLGLPAARSSCGCVRISTG